MNGWITMEHQAPLHQLGVLRSEVALLMDRRDRNPWWWLTCLCLCEGRRALTQTCMLMVFAVESRTSAFRDAFYWLSVGSPGLLTEACRSTSCAYTGLIEAAGQGRESRPSGAEHEGPVAASPGSAGCSV